jgi:hypothetical protein
MIRQQLQIHLTFPRRYVLPGLLALACLLLAATGVRADATYCYQGPAFTSLTGPATVAAYAPGDAISGCLTLDATLGANQAFTFFDNSDVISFNFTDGFISLSTAPDTFVEFLGFATTGGQITSWVLSLEDLPVTKKIFSVNNFTDPGDLQFEGREDEDITIAPDGSVITDAGSFCVCDPSGVWTTKSVTTPMPEPNSLALLILALSLVGIAARFSSNQRGGRHTI